MNENIIFLDFDGVLRPFNTELIKTGVSSFTGNMRYKERHTSKYAYCNFAPECVAPFNRIIKSIEKPRIVCTSSWRHLAHYRQDVYLHLLAMENQTKEHIKELQKLWTERRLLGKFIDITPSLSMYNIDKRSEEVSKWLFENRDMGFRDYAILDDLEWIFSPSKYSIPLEGNLFITKSEIGLTEEDADKIIEHFNNE